ncbi:MAG: alpha/beta fold hydrolase [bacterium]
MIKKYKKVFITILSILFISVITYFGLCIYALSTTPKSVFEVEKSKNDVFTLPITRDFRKDKDGNNIELISLQNTQSQDVILYFGGTSGRAPKDLETASTVANVVSPAPPGYAQSTGTPTSSNIYNTVDVGIAFLHEKGYTDDKIIIMGHSMGGSLAVYGASHYPGIKKVILVNTFYSIQKMCEKDFSVLCILLRDFMNTSKLAPDVKVKVRQFSNPNDEKIPYEQQKQLFEKIGSTDKKFINIEGTHGTFDAIKVLSTD